MAERVALPGGRNASGVLDSGDDGETNAAVVACPPHPQYGGSRSDQRLVAVANALTARGVDGLRFDYGPWGEGRGESTDARNAVRWARERYDRVGIFGYSFGGSMALLAATDEPVDAISVLAPAAGVGEGLDPVGAVDDIDAPLQVVYGTRDDTADWQPIVERAREENATVVALEGDHFFVGQDDVVSEAVGPFLADVLRQ